MQKGFTLIEILAVIIILSLIIIISTPFIIETMEKGKDNLNNSQINNIEKAAKNWGLSNVDIVDGVPDCNYVTIDTLKESGYLDERDIKELTNNTNIDPDTRICITYQNGYLNYQYDGDC